MSPSWRGSGGGTSTSACHRHHRGRSSHSQRGAWSPTGASRGGQHAVRTTPRECASPSTATARKRLRSDALLMGFTWRYEGSSRKARRELERGVAAALPGHAMISEPLGFALVRHTRLDFPLASRHPGRTPLALFFQLGVLCMNAARVLRVLDGCIRHARVRHRATVRFERGCTHNVFAARPQSAHDVSLQRLPRLLARRVGAHPFPERKVARLLLHLLRQRSDGGARSEVSARSGSAN